MILAFEIIAAVYVIGFLYNFMGLRACILECYSELGWHEHRKTVFYRALLWFIPASIFYWRDVKWEREKDLYD